MILSDRSIIYGVTQGTIEISNFNERFLGPNSYDVTLKDDIRVYDPDDQRNWTIMDIDVRTGQKNHKVFCLDTTQRTNLRKLPKDTKNGTKGYFLYPGVLYLGATNEVVGSNTFVQELHGRSSMARLGITVHSAGYGDVGFKGTWTLELSVIHPVFIVPNMRIAQIQFSKLDQSPLHLYSEKDTGAKYNNQDDPRGYIPDAEIMGKEDKRIGRDS